MKDKMIVDSEKLLAAVNDTGEVLVGLKMSVSQRRDCTMHLNRVSTKSPLRYVGVVCGLSVIGVDFLVARDDSSKAGNVPAPAGIAEYVGGGRVDRCRHDDDERKERKCPGVLIQLK